MASTACAAPSMKIGVIDTQKVLHDSKAAKEARQVFLMDVEKKRSIYKSKEESVRSLQEQLKNEGPKMNEAALKRTRDTLADEIKDLNRLKTDLSDDLKKKDAELTQKLLKEINEVVQDYSAREKFTIIFDRRMLIDFDEKIEITDDILKLYDNKSN
jgi:outer membrane protein